MKTLPELSAKNKKATTDALGDRMKFYEGQYADRLLPMIPAVARLDGRAFHTFTRKFARPYDERFSKLMVDVTKYLVEESNARVGYTQSDEITLIWLADSYQSEIYFDGRLAKMTSMLASACSVYFNQQMNKYIEEAKGPALFDCRVWSVPSKSEACNVLIWREMDATRNSIQMAGQAYFSHKEMQGKNSSQVQEMLFSKHGINWNNYPAFFKRGTYIQRREVERPYSCDEISKLPLKHEARKNPALTVKRKDTVEIDYGRLSAVLNREDCIFDGDSPSLPVNDASTVSA